MFFRKFFTKDREGPEPFPTGVHIPSLRREASQRSSIALSGESEASSSSTSGTGRFSKKSFSEHFLSHTQSTLYSEHGALTMPVKGSRRAKSTQSAVSLSGFKKGFFTGSNPSVHARHLAGSPRPYSINDSLSLTSEPTSPVDASHSFDLPDSLRPNFSPVPSPMQHSPVEEEMDLSKQLEIVEDRLKKMNYGAISISTNQRGYATIYSANLLGRKQRPSDDVPFQYLHPSFMAMYAEPLIGLERIEELDVEVCQRFEGLHPGTVSMSGLGWEIWDAADRAQPRTQTVYYSMAPIPNVPGPDIIQRLNELATGGLSKTSPQVEVKSLVKLIGLSTTAFFDAENPYNAQIGDLLRVLNREDRFEDFSLVESPYLLAVAAPPDGIGPRAFLFQILLGYELLLRLEATPGVSFPGITQQINSNLLMSNRWIKNVTSELQNSALKTTSKIADSQIEGLLFFGEYLQWPVPLMEEVRKFIEDVCARHAAGERIDSNFIDFLYGIMLPGRYFSHKIMTALLYATPSIRRYGTSPHYDAGLVLASCSYWRSRTPLGRVLGGLGHTVKCVTGWIGPCPPVTTTDGPLVEGWTLVRGKPIPFKTSLPAQDERTEEDHQPAEQPPERGLRVRPGETPRDLLRELSDMTKWQSPPSPKQSEITATVERLALKQLPLDEDDYETNVQCEASLVFNINGESTAFSITHAPVFVAAPACENGPHLAHVREISRFNQCLDVHQLKNAKTSEDGILVINATGPGGDIVARAWCAEVGRHALIRRGDTSCFTCALNTAENMHFNVLIWA